jgi:hypothetical protein
MVRAYCGLRQLIRDPGNVRMLRWSPMGSFTKENMSDAEVPQESRPEVELGVADSLVSVLRRAC